MSSFLRNAAIVVGIYGATCCTSASSSDCSQKPSLLHATWYYDSACGGSCQAQCDPGWLNARGHANDDCDTSADDNLMLHQQMSSNGLNECYPVCDSDGRSATTIHPRGVKHPRRHSATPAPRAAWTVVSTAEAHRLDCQSCKVEPVTSRAPAACSSWSTIRFASVDAVTLVNSYEATSSALLFLKGLACDGIELYWTTPSTVQPSPNGTLWRLAIGTHTPVAIASGLDPGRGIDTRQSNIYWIARSNLSDAGSVLAMTSDAGTVAVMPTVETGAYKAFALGDDGDYGLASGMIYRNALDGGGVAVCVNNASGASSLVASGAAPWP